MATETGPVLDLIAQDITNPYEVVQLGLAANLGMAYNANAGTGLTGDHTTLASAYASGAVSLSGAPPNIIKPVVGFPMPHGVKTCIYYPFRVPSGSLGGALTSGLTFELLLAMHPNANDADLSGTVAYFDFVGTKINASSQAAGATTNTPDDFMFSTTTCVAAATAALPTAVSRFHVHSQAVTNAALNTPAVGEWILVRIRRLGDHQLDTNVGSIVVVAVSAFAY